MKRFKLTLPSIMAIVLCALLFAGSTFALFTSIATASVSVTSAKVDVDSELTSLKIYSADPNATEGELAGTIDEGNHKGTYRYVEQNETFANGGTVEYDAESLTIDRMTPGDKVTLKLEATNKSNVYIKYRVFIESSADSNEDLLSVMQIKLSGNADLGTKDFTGLKSYKSAWIEKQIPTSTSDNLEDINIEIILPLSVESSELNNFKYEDKTIGFSIRIVAVQGNGATSGIETMTFVEKTVYNYEDVTAEAQAEENEDLELTAEIADTDVTISTTVPASMLEADDEVKFEVKNLSVSYDNQTQANTVKVDLSLTIEDNAISQPVQVEINLGTGMYIESFKHNDVALTLGTSKDSLQNGEYFYDSQTGILYFVTDSFSPFEVVYTDGRTVKTAEALAEAVTRDHIEVKLAANIEIDAEDLNMAEGTTINANGFALTINASSFAELEAMVNKVNAKAIPNPTIALEHDIDFTKRLTINNSLTIKGQDAGTTLNGYYTSAAYSNPDDEWQSGAFYVDAKEASQSFNFINLNFKNFGVYTSQGVLNEGGSNSGIWGTNSEFNPSYLVKNCKFEGVGYHFARFDSGYARIENTTFDGELHAYYAPNLLQLGAWGDPDNGIAPTTSIVADIISCTFVNAITSPEGEYYGTGIAPWCNVTLNISGSTFENCNYYAIGFSTHWIYFAEPVINVSEDTTFTNCKYNTYRTHWISADELTEEIAAGIHYYTDDCPHFGVKVGNEYRADAYAIDTIDENGGIDRINYFVKGTYTYQGED